MMRAPLIIIVLSIMGDAACAQPANEAVKELETCFQLARAADAICSDPKNGAAERLDCLQKARTSQLECLEQVPQGMSAATAPPGKPAASGAPAIHSAAVSPDKSEGSGEPEMPSAAISPDKPANIVAPNSSQVTAPPEIATGAVSPDVAAKAVDIPSKSPATNWVVSQTTSPVDYTPLITAAIRLPSSEKHAPDTLAIRCRGRRTELVVRTAGTWRLSRSGDVQVDYQINDQPSVKQAWAASADGRTAIYKDDPVGLLQSLPDGARLKINVFDGPDSGHEATFQLGGWDAVREKIAAACKWPPMANKMSSEKR
jgi:hypothetical protein